MDGVDTAPEPSRAKSVNQKPLTDAERFAKIAADCAKSSTEALENVKKFSQGLTDLDEREGISLLEVKNHDLLSYLADMGLIMRAMTKGESIADTRAVDRTVKLRTYLERVRATESKMKDQIQKLLLRSSEGAPTLRARPEMMEFDDDEGQEEEEEDAEEGAEKTKAKESRVYVPKKLVAVPYNDNTAEEYEKQRRDRLRRKALSSTLVQELREQFGDAPVEEFQDNFTPKQRVKEDDRQKWEEEHMTRLPKMGGERKRKNELTAQAAGMNTLEDLLKFGDYRAGTEKSMNRKAKGGPINVSRRSFGGGGKGKKRK